MLLRGGFEVHEFEAESEACLHEGDTTRQRERHAGQRDVQRELRPLTGGGAAIDVTTTEAQIDDANRGASAGAVPRAVQTHRPSRVPAPFTVFHAIAAARRDNYYWR